MDRKTPNHSQPTNSTITPNQNHSIQFSSKFINQSQKPVSLAHFMGARRDLNGPVLTKKRVDENEIRPDGWEAAEKRYQTSNQSQSGISSLANLLSISPVPASGSKSGLSSHAANLSKRPLPGMVPQESIINHHKSPQQPSSSSQPSSGINKFKQRSLPNPPTTPSSTTTLSTSHADSYLKPKSLADRMAQLGVSNEPIIKSPISASSNSIPSIPIASSPRVDKFSIDHHHHHHHKDIGTDRDLHDPKNTRITKSNLTRNNNNLASQQNLLSDENQNPKKPPPLSAPIFPSSSRGLPSPKLNKTSHFAPTLPSSHHHSSREPSNASGLTSQLPAESDPSNKRNSRTLPNLPPQAPQAVEQSAHLGVPHKSLTASLSRLAGSNIVAQRLQWSKEKEQLVTVDELGSPLLKNSSSPISSSSRIPSPALSANPTKIPEVFSERNRNSPEFPAENPSSRTPLSRLRSSQSENDGPKSADPTHKKYLNEYNKSARSDEDNEQQILFENANRDNKRNKKHANQTPSSPIKDQNADTSPLRPHHKNRARGSHRPSSSFGSHPTNRTRTELPKAFSPPANPSRARLPSIPSFSPMMRKGTSELAAVWGGQLSNPVKKKTETNDHHLKKVNLPSASPRNTTRPLPSPPGHCLPLHSKITGGPDSRPLPVPPSSSAIATDSNSESRPISRPLPIPQPRSSEGSHHVGFKEKDVIPSFKSQPSTVDVSKIWASYEEKDASLAGLAQPKALIQMEIFQLNRNQLDEFSTTMLDPDDYGTFYSQETLLIICTLKGSSMVLLIWKGKDVVDSDDGMTEAKIERLLKKYGIERQSKLVMVNQGYEPAELVEALGGRLVLRTGDRYDSVFQRTRSALFTCKSFRTRRAPADWTINTDDSVVVIEETLLDSSKSLVEGRLCTGYCGLVKLCAEGSEEKMRLYLWKGKCSNDLEVEECKLLAQQIQHEAGPFKASIQEIDEGLESEELRATFGEENFARSYHWKYKGYVPMRSLMTNASGQMIGRVGQEEVSIVHTGLEIFVIVPSSQRKNHREIHSALLLGQRLSLTDHHHHPPSGSPKRILAVNCLLFPTLIPVDLLACVRFPADLMRLNLGFDRVDKMNLMSLAEGLESF